MVFQIAWEIITSSNEDQLRVTIPYICHITSKQSIPFKKKQHDLKIVESLNSFCGIERYYENILFHIDFYWLSHGKVFYLAKRKHFKFEDMLLSVFW